MREKLAIALVGIIPACLTAALGYSQGIQQTDYKKASAELTDRSLELKNDPNPNFRKLSYPNYGLSLDAPVSWTAEDGPAQLAGGEFNLVSRYEESKAAIGMNFRLRPVQPNYINDIAAQVANQMDVFKKIDPNSVVKDITISALPGKLFEYKQSTGKRNMEVKLYCIRLAPNVQLQILAAQYEDAQDKVQFWTDEDRVISSIVIALDTWQARYKERFLRS